MSKLKASLIRFKQFVEVDIWRTKLSELPKSQSLIYHNLRIAIITFRDFAADNCGVKASALTYLSILSIVPVIATLFGVAKGFGMEINLQEQLAQLFSGQEMVMNETFKYAQRMLDNAKGGVIAGFSIAFLLYTVLMLFHNIELAFNDIWGIKEQRSIIRKVTDYLAIVILAPLILVVSSSMTVMLNTQLDSLMSKYELLEYAVTLIQLGLRIVPLFLICFMFSLFYILMPYTKVKPKSALWAGLLAGIVYQFVQYGYIEFQVGVSRYNAIYGSFAALPLFFIWVQLSWMIVLFGAEFAFAHQNAYRYNLRTDKLILSASRKKMLALLVMTSIVKNFEKGEKPITDNQIADLIGVPVRFVIIVLAELKESNLVVAVNLPNDEVGYLPITDIHKITIFYVLNKLESRGLDEVSMKNNEEVEHLEAALAELNTTLEQSAANKLLLDL